MCVANEFQNQKRFWKIFWWSLKPITVIMTETLSAQKMQTGWGALCPSLLPQVILFCKMLVLNFHVIVGIKTLVLKILPLPKKSVLDWELVLTQMRERREERGQEGNRCRSGFGFWRCLHGFGAVTSVLMSQLVLKNKVLMSLNLLCSHLL